LFDGYTGTALREAAVRDGLVDAPGANNRCPREGHLVALAIEPYSDHHWYRKGRDGLWTHKVGTLPVTDRDSSGNVISDPRTADRRPYTEFVTFMVVKHGHIRIR
jgi:hypothetical protein